MRKLCFLLAFFILPLFVYAENLPQPTGWVNDFAGVISADDKEKLNSLIGGLEEKTSAEIAVVTVTSIAPYDENEYARLLFDNWKPGKKGKDNGVLVLLAVKERRWRIETGYGIEGILPDGLCGEIGRNYMVPYFKEGRYAEGFYQGTLKIASVISGETKYEPRQLTDSRGRTGLIYPLILVIGIISVISSWKVFFAILASSLILAFFLKIFYLLPVLLFFFILVTFIRLSSTPNRYRDNHYYRGYGSGSWGGGFGGGGFGGGGFGGGGGGGGGAGGGF